MRRGGRVMVALGLLLFATVLLPATALAQGSGPADVAVAPTANANGPYFANPGQPITFDGTGSTDPEGGELVYSWDFGDRASGEGPNPVHAYDAPGTYTVTLTVTDKELLQDEDTAQVEVNAAPIAEANGPYAGNEGEAISFSSAGSTDPDGDPLTYLWDFGDGATSTEANPTHTYTTGGPFTATLTVTDPTELSDSDTAAVTVNRAPVAEANGPYAGNVDETISFSSAGSTDPDRDPLDYLWEFGDGETSTSRNPNHTYTSGGPFTATLTVTDPDGLTGSDTASVDVNRPPVAEANGPYAGNEGEAIAFSSAGSTDPDGDPLDYLWEFGDGSTSTDANPSHIYTNGGPFTATLTVSDPDGLTGSDTASVDVNRPPVAEANGPYTGNVGEAIAFSSAGSTDPDGDPLDYLWDFGDGLTSTDANPSHTYTNGGPFTATLTVSDPDGLTGNDTASVDVNRPPVAEANGPYAGNVGEAIAFSSAGSTDPDGDPLDYLWDFGDGSTSTDANPTHTYTGPGDFTATLRVTDPGGLFAEDTAPVTVIQPNRSPVAEANGPYAGNVGEAISFSSAGSTDPDGDPLTYFWEFGDGETSTEANPSHTYTSGGPFTATLTVTDPSELTGQDTAEVAVNRAPVAEANGPYRVMLEEVVQFSSAGSTDPDGDPLEYLWDFGDGESSTEANPSHTYASGGTYTATLTVTDPGSLFGEDTAEVTVNRPPVAEANGPYAGAVGEPIAFSSAGSTDPDGDPLEYLWDFGDGESSTEANPSHSYTSGGPYTATLRVSDPDGLFDEDTASVAVNRPPVAEANGPYSGDRGRAIAFSSAGSTDPDGGLLTYLWNFGDGGTSTDANPTHTYTSGGPYTATLRVTDPDDLFDEDEADVIVVDIIITTPAGGEVWSEATTQTIEWTLIPPGSVGNVIVEYTLEPDSPNPLWALIGNATGSAGSIAWTVPDIGSADRTAVIRVLRSTGQPLFDVSERFTIQNRTLGVARPRSGDQVFERSTFEITWTSAGFIERVELAYRLSPNNAWQVIEADTPNDGSYIWDLDFEVARDWNQARVRISDVADPVATSDVSDEFTILNRTVTITSPQGGEVWSEGSNQLITWEPRGPIGELILEFRRGPAQAYEEITRVQADTQSHSWFVAPVNDDAPQAQVRIRDAQANVVDESSFFTIQNRVIEIVAPALNDQISERSQTEIEWTSVGFIENVRIEYRLRPNGSWDPVVDSTPNTGTYTWSTPEVTDDETGVQIRITDVATGADLARRMSAAFTLVNRVIVTESPAPGESRCESDTVFVSWTFRGDIPAVDLDWRPDPGTTWDRIVSDLPNTGSFIWLTPDLPATSDQVQLRIRQADDQSVGAIWEPFTLGNRTLDIQVPGGGETYSEGDLVLVEFTADCIDSVRVEARRRPEDPWELQGRGVWPNLGRLLWTVIRVDQEENQVELRLSDSSDPNGVFAISRPFTVQNRVLDVVRPTVTDEPSETETFTIEWSWVGSLQEVDIDYRLDPALDWVRIVTALENVDGTYDWTVPEVDRDYPGAQVRVFDSNNPVVFDESDVFLIVNRALAVVHPSSTDTLTEAAPDTVRWSTRGLVPLVTLSYREGPAAPWQVLEASVPNSGDYVWTVPEVDGDAPAAQVRITHASEPAIVGESEPFVILDRSFTFLAPAGGERWSEATDELIEWTARGDIDSVRIELVLPGGGTQVIFDSTPNDGQELWSIPDLEMTLDDVTLRISDVRPPSAGANSAPFTLVDRSIAIQSPAGERIEWRVGSMQEIEWGSTGAIPSIAIELSRDGVNFALIAGGLLNGPDGGSYTWEVTGPPAFPAFLRVRDLSMAAADTREIFAIYDLVPPDQCADFDHSGMVTLEELIRVESIVVGGVRASEWDSLAADGNRDGLINLLDILCGADDMLETEIAGGGRSFTDAGPVAAAEEGVVLELGEARSGEGVPITIDSQVSLAGLLVEVEVSGGTATPLKGEDAAGFVLDWVTSGPDRIVATIRRGETGENLPPGARAPLVLDIDPSGEGEVTVTLTRAEAVGGNLALLPVHLAGRDAAVVPLRMALGQNRPNPFNPTTVIPFETPVSQAVRLEIFDVSGRLVRRLVDEWLPAGFHSARWDGRDTGGREVASGIYLYTLRSGGESQTRKMTILR